VPEITDVVPGAGVNDSCLHQVPAMKAPRTRLSDTTLLILFGVAIFLVHLAVNGRYGFHRDELLTYDNARHLAWGYVVYPPLTPFLARVELLLFGASLRGFRFIAAAAQGIMALFTGLTAREMGAQRYGQTIAAAAFAISGPSLFNGGFMSYATLDELWWVLAAWSVARLLRTQNPRWWVSVGAAIGLGLMTRYTIGLLVLGILGGLLFTSARRNYKSPWFWAGAAIALAICLPNFLWQMQHDFIWLKWVHSIHARDVRDGGTDDFLLNQLWKITNPATVPLWITGLWLVLVKPEGKPWRLLGWMYAVPLLILLVLRGRDYYLAGAYPILFAAGAVQMERWLATLSARAAGTVRGVTWWAFAANGLILAGIALPLAPINSRWWHIADAATGGNYNSQIGWPEGVASVAHVRDALTLEEQASYAILVGDDGEAGAIDLYGPAYHLPPSISGMNSAWARGYGDPPPQTIIAVNMDPDFLERSFASCQVAARLSNRWGIANSAVPNADVYVCRGLRKPWPEFWAKFQYYG